MDDADGVGIDQRVGDLGADGGGERRGQGAVRAEEAAEVAAGGVLGHEVGPALVLPVVVDRDHVRRVQPGQDRGLALEALQELRRMGEVAEHHFHRDLAREVQVGRRVDHAHAADADDAVDPVGTEGAADLGRSSVGSVGHGKVFPRKLGVRLGRLRPLQQARSEACSN